MSTSNCTGHCLSEEKLRKSFVKYSLYGIEGVILAVTNLPLFVAIIRQKTLRQKKEYVITAGILLVNGMLGVAGVVGGGLRSYYISSGVANEKKSRWSCFLTPYQQLWTWVDMLNPISLTIASLDRLLAIAVPVWYYKRNAKYAYCMLGAGLAFTAVWYVTTGISVYPYQQELYPRICSQDYSHSPQLYRFLAFSRFFFVSFSIVLYPIIIILHRRHSAKVAPTTTRQRAKEMNRQRKITISLGISSLITFIFFFIPQLIDLYLSTRFSFGLINDIGPVISLLCQIDPLADTIILTVRHKDLRLACQYLVKCKTLTQMRLNQISTATAQVTDRKAVVNNNQNVSVL